MTVIFLILLIAALVCFLLGAFASHRVTQVNLVALGLALWVTVPLIQVVQTL